MAEKEVETATAPVQVASAGKPVGSPFPFPTYTENREEGNGNENNNGGDAAAQNNGAAATTNTNTANSGNETADDKNKGGENSSTGNNSTQTNAPAEPTDDQLKAWFEKQGIPFENVESLKAKVTATAAKELTPEEKQQVEAKKNKRLLDEHLSDPKRTVEQFAAIPTILATDKKILGLEKELRFAISEGFSKEAAEAYIKDKYSQYTDEEINAIEDKDEKEQMIKERALGTKKLEGKGDYIQKQVKIHLDNLEQSIADKDADTSLVEQHASNVEAAIKKYERKQTIDMGQVEDQKIDPIGFEVPESAITSAKDIIGDLPKLKKQLLTESGHVNLDFLLPHIIKSLAFDSVAKTGYLEGQDRSVKQFKAKFGSNMPTLGANQNGNAAGKGKVVSAGKPTVGRPEYKN